MNLTNELSSLFNVAGKATTAVGSISGTNSLSKIAKVATVKPLCIVDAAMTHSEHTPNVVNASLNLFIRQYVTAIQLYGQVGGVTIAGYLDKFNPERQFFDLYTMLESDYTPVNNKRDYQMTEAIKAFSNGESYKFSLPSLEAVEYYTPKGKKRPAGNQKTTSPSANGNKAPETKYKLKTPKDKSREVKLTPVTNVTPSQPLPPEERSEIQQYIDEEIKPKLSEVRKVSGVKDDPTPSSVRVGNLKQAYASGDLFVGKVVDVTIKINRETMTIPITFSVSSVPLPSDTLLTMLANKKQETMVEKWHGWKSGRLEFWRDIMFNQKLVEEHERALMYDKTGTYAEIHARASKNAAAAVLSQQPSLATASNIYIIADTTVDLLKRRSGVDITIAKQRQGLFDRTMASIIVVMSNRYEMCTIYENGQDRGVMVAYSQIPKLGGKKDDDVTDVLKTIIANRPTSFR